MVMAIRRKKETLLKIAGPKIKIYINGHPINIWVDSGLPMSILTLDDLSGTCSILPVTFLLFLNRRNVPKNGKW